MRQKSDVHVGGKSDGRVIPSKCPNNSGQPLAEGTEGRRPIKENIEQTTARRTQSRISELSGLLGVRKAARKDKRRGSARCSTTSRSTCCGTASTL